MKPKVLYVDDEAINLSNFKISFSDTFDIVCASSGKEALELFRVGSEDLAVVIADQRMPEMSGVQLLAKLYEIDPAPTRIILTGYCDFNDIMEAVNEGHIFNYVQKPWDYEYFKHLMCQAVSKHEMIKERKRLLAELEDKNHELSRQLQKNILSEQKKREAEVRMLSQAKLASLGEMATGIAHEVNQPLSYLRVVLEAIKKDSLNKRLDEKELREDINTALDQITRITTITDHLRVFGRAADKEFSSVNLKLVVENSLIPLSQRIKFANIDFTLDISADLSVFGNSLQLEQIFINLLVNAIDALEDVSDKKLSIKASESGTYAELVISDNGCGMDQEVSKRAFDPFFTTKDVGKGTGIGLSIAYGIITDHKGTINCISKVGAGTTFIVRLPLV